MAAASSIGSQYTRNCRKSTRYFDGTSLSSPVPDKPTLRYHSYQLSDE